MGIYSRLIWDSKHTSRDYSSVIAREPALRRRSGGRSPEVVRGVGEEIGTGFGEEGGAAAISLGEDHLVEEHDFGIIRGVGFALMDEFVETCEKSQNHCV